MGFSLSSRTTSSLLIAAVCALAADCGNTGAHATGRSTSSSSGSVGAGGSMPSPGADTTVTPFAKTPVYFTGSDNKRTVDVPTSFPAMGAYQTIVLHLALDCPTGGGEPPPPPRPLA